jgi:hypothetical protein
MLVVSLRRFLSKFPKNQLIRHESNPRRDIRPDDDLTSYFLCLAAPTSHPFFSSSIIHIFAFVNVDLDTKRRAVFSTFVNAKLVTKGRALFEAILAAIFRTFFDAKLDTKRRAILDAASAAVFRAFFDADLNTK